MERGKLNRISDVEGVLVGHKTIIDNEHQTGVTFIRTAPDIFHHKLACGCSALNGFGKTTGLPQIQELGTLESYICLTNTLNVGVVQQALVDIMVQENDDLQSVNVVVGECNDSYLNAIRDCVIQKEDVFEAYHNCTKEFELGSIGAGRGMSCFEMSGGIGSSSRVFEIDGKMYTLGILVLTNFGLRHQYLLDKLEDTQSSLPQEKGSIMMIIATDAPLSDRQLHRVCNRMPVALALCGSHMGNGSGDIAIAFSTANTFSNESIHEVKQLNDNKINVVFDAAIEACQEAIHLSLLENEEVVGYNGHVRPCLNDLKKD